MSLSQPQNGQSGTSQVPRLVWTPQEGPQKSLIDCPLSEVFFGGARGGGKTDGMLGKWAIKDARYGEGFNAIMFRRTTTSSEDAVERSKQIYGPLGGKFNESKLRWRMPNGGRVSFRYLDKLADAQAYQGRNLTDAWVEEAGQYPSPMVIDRLFGVLRSSTGVPVQLVMTANPGGPGQHWLRERYRLFPFPQGPKVHSRLLENGKKHYFAVIPSRISDNKIMTDADPEYVDRLHMVGSAALVKAWLEGDWSAVEGAFFDEWSTERHVVPPFPIPQDWMRFRSADWGSRSPFSVGWWAVATEDYHYNRTAGLFIPRGAMVRYREWYGTGGKLTAEQVGEGVVSREKGDPKASYGVLDPAAFNEDGGPSIGERINRVLTTAKRVPFRKADNARVAREGAMGGWDHMRARLIGTARKTGKGTVDWSAEGAAPMIFFFSTCTDTIRTIPTLQHDQDKAEDLDTTAEDHAADDVRYGCMSRPWTRTPEAKPLPRDGWGDTESLNNESFMSL